MFIGPFSAFSGTEWPWFVAVTYSLVYSHNTIHDISIIFYYNKYRHCLHNITASLYSQ